MKKTIGEKIAAKRKALGLTQEQLGEKMNVSGQAVSKWECSESLPDITLLPALCGLLGISADELLDIPAIPKEADIMKDFCVHARKNGRTDTLLDALGRLYNDAGANHGGQNNLIAPDEIRLYDGRGMGFLLKGSHMETLNQRPAEEIAYFLRLLTDEVILHLLRRISFDDAVTIEELCEAEGVEEAVVTRALLGLMKRSIICCDVDSKGKRGYLYDWGIAGVYMALSGCEAADCGGDLRGNLWFTRGKFVPHGDREDQTR